MLDHALSVNSPRPTICLPFVSHVDAPRVIHYAAFVRQTLVGFHWYDLIPLVMLFLLFVGLVVVGLSVGTGYALMPRRLEQRPEHL